MVAYSLGANRTTTDMDGAGTDLESGDTVTTNGYTLTNDETDGTCASGNVTVSPTGFLVNNAACNWTWDSGSTLTVNGGVKINGTSGSTVTWVEASGTKLIIASTAGGFGNFYANYATMTFLRVTQLRYMYCVNSTIQGLAYVGGMGIGVGTNFGWYIFDTCTVSDGSQYGVFSNYSGGYGNTYVMLNCTVTQSGNLLYYSVSASYPMHILMGKTTFAGIEPNMTTHGNGSGATTDPIIFTYYGRIASGIGESGFVALSKTDATKVGDIIYNVPNYYDNAPPGGAATVSNTNVAYAIAKREYQAVRGFADGWVSYSDQNQAASGNNSAYTAIGAVSGKYTTSQAAVWAIPTSGDSTTGVTLSFSMSSVGTAPTISTQLLDDYAITTRESTTATMTGTASMLGIVEANNNYFLLTESPAGTYTRTLTGYEIGTCSTETVTFHLIDTAASMSSTANAGSTLTVSAAAANTDDMPYDIATYLQTSGVATLGTDMFIGRLPDSVDTAIAIIPRQGERSDIITNFVYPSCQILVRDTTWNGASVMALNIHDTLHQLTNQTINGRIYHRIEATGQPADVGDDANDRIMFSVNFSVIKEED